MINRSNLLQLSIVAWMAFVWLLLWGTVSIGNVLAGLAVGLLLTVLLPLPRVPVEGRVHLRSMLRLFAVILVDSIRSSLDVAWLAIRPSAPPVTGVLRCRLSIKSDLVLTLWTDIMNNIPGTMVLEIDQARRIMYVHVLDVGTDKAVENFYRSARRIERLLIATFERDADWKPSPWHRDHDEHQQAEETT